MKTDDKCFHISSSVGKEADIFDRNDSIMTNITLQFQLSFIVSQFRFK